MYSEKSTNSFYMMRRKLPRLFYEQFLCYTSLIIFFTLLLCKIDVLTICHIVYFFHNFYLNPKYSKFLLNFNINFWRRLQNFLIFFLSFPTNYHSEFIAIKLWIKDFLYKKYWTLHSAWISGSIYKVFHSFLNTSFIYHRSETLLRSTVADHERLGRLKIETR